LNAQGQSQVGFPVALSELQAGDLVFYDTLKRPYSHVGIYMGEGKFLHSPKSGAQVRVESMKAVYWNQRYNGARRVEPPL
jgi:cell wall-associated NlpC family hydrolase